MKLKDFTNGRNFQKLTDYEYVRTTPEAAGFFIVHLGILLLSVIIIGTILTAGHAGTPAARVMPHFLTALYCTILGIYMIMRKRMRSWQPWALAGLICIASFIHVFLGVGLLAYITTRPMWWPIGVPPAEKPKPVLKPAPKPVVIRKPAPKAPAPPRPDNPKKSAVPPLRSRPKKERINPELGSEERGQEQAPDKKI